MADFKTCFAVPFGCKDHFIGIVAFFSNESVPFCTTRMHTLLTQANQILFEASHPKLGAEGAIYLFTKGSYPRKQKQVPAKYRAHENTLSALRTTPESRNEEVVSNIVKVSRRLPFFRYMSNTCREVLCQTMELITVGPGADIVAGRADEDFVWYVLIRGGVDIVVRDASGQQAFAVHAVVEGGAFSRAYLDLFGPPVADAAGRTSAGGSRAGSIRASDLGATCVRIFVPEEWRGQFRGQTKPLMYQVPATAAGPAPGAGCEPPRTRPGAAEGTVIRRDRTVDPQDQPASSPLTGREHGGGGGGGGALRFSCVGLPLKRVRRSAGMRQRLLPSLPSLPSLLQSLLSLLSTFTHRTSSHLYPLAHPLTLSSRPAGAGVLLHPLHARSRRAAGHLHVRRRPRPHAPCPHPAPSPTAIHSPPSSLLIVS